MKGIIFRISEIRCVDGVWKFYPAPDLPPICIKNSLLNPEYSRTLRVGQAPAAEPHRLYIDTEKDRSITHLGMNFVTLFDLSQNPDCAEIPVLPDAYRPTRKECMQHLQHECCACCPWCKQIAPAGYFTIKYPSESYQFTPAKTDKR